MSSRIRQPRNIPAPSPAELDIFFRGLSLGDTKPALLSLVSPYSNGFVPKQAQVAFPALLPDLYKEDLYKQPFNVVLGKCSSAKDEVLWEEMLPKARHFFQVGVLPELLGKCYTRPPVVACPVNAASVDSSEKPQALWCYCQKEESGDMVACDGGSCQYEWFHYMCVGVLSEPKGKWFCPECRKDRRKQRMQKR